MQREIIYCDDDITVVWQAGSSDFLLITFGDMVTLASGNRFYADGPVTKLKLNCIGFMAKRANWFPKRSVEAAIGRISGILFRFPSRMTYGGSMGGYAAIKYSALLHATNVIAFCPQWSIDPAECAGEQSGYDRFFQTSMATMGIRKEEISGDVCVLLDPSYKIDAFHYAKIAAIGGNVIPINIHGTDHHVTSVLASSSVFSELIEACRSKNYSKLYSITNRARRTSRIRRRLLLRKAVAKHPVLVMKAISSSSKGDRCSMEDDELTLFLVNLFVRGGELALARQAITCFSDSYSRYKVELLCDMITSIEANVFVSEHGFISTHHNTVLVFCSIDGKLRHVTQDLLHTGNPGFVPVVLHSDGDKNVLALWTRGKVLACTMDPEGGLELENVGVQMEQRSIFQIDVTGNNVTLKIRDNYVCADPMGEVHYNRKRAMAWETFTRTPARLGIYHKNA